MTQMATEGRVIREFTRMVRKFARIGCDGNARAGGRGGSVQAERLAEYYYFSPAAYCCQGEDPPWRGPIQARASREGRVRGDGQGGWRGRGGKIRRSAQAERPATTRFHQYENLVYIPHPTGIKALRAEGNNQKPRTQKTSRSPPW